MRDFDIDSDLKQEKFQNIKLVQGDRGNKIKINVYEDGQPVNLAGCSVTAKYKRADGKIINDGVIENIHDNSFDAVMDSSITKVAGTLKMLFTIEKDDVKVSTFLLLADVRESIGENTGSSGGNTGGGSGEVTIDLSNYYKKIETYSKNQIDARFKDIANKNIMQKTSNDTEELKRIIAKAKLNKTNIVIPSGDWHINTDEIILDFDGLTIEGENSWGTKIISTGSGVLFKLLNGAGEIRNPIFKNLFIEGSNEELYEGIAFDCGGDTYAGRAIKFENVQIRYFKTGIKLKHIDNCLFSNTGISYCTKNIHLVGGSNCNTITFNNTMTSSATETSILLESGSGLVIQGGDHVNCEQIRVKNANTQVTVIGGNFENCANEGAFVVEPNATLIGIGNRFLKQSTGQDIEQCTVYKNGRLTLISPITGGYSKPLVKKLDSSMVQVYSPTTSIYSGGNEINDMDKAIYRGNGGIESRLGSGVPSATNRMRGMTLFLAQPDGSNLTDRLLQYVKLSDGSYKALDLLQGSLYFTDSSSSFNQSTSAKILNGKKYSQTLSKELEYTDVVVNIGAYTKLYNCVCSIYDGMGRDFRVIHKSHNPSTGDITFRVFHGTLTSDTTTCINYTISIDI